MISTRSLGGLPDIDGLRRLTRALAMLDAILCADWESRYYSFNSQWAAGEVMASMRDGSGDQWFALFTEVGAALHGLAHESPMFRRGNPWPGIWDSFPSALAGFRAEPAFDTKDSTFCIWRMHSDAAWQRGEIDFPQGHHDPDGSTMLLSMLDGVPQTYCAWASEYYECELPVAALAAVYDHSPLTEALVRALKADASLRSLQPDVAEIGYPDAG